MNRELMLQEKLRKMVSPVTKTPLIELGAGNELDLWVASVLGYPESDVPPFSTDWCAAGMLLEKCPKKQMIMLTYYHLKERWDHEKQKSVPLKPEEQKCTWSFGGLGFGEMEGRMDLGSEDPKVAICRGLIWRELHKE